MIRADLHIHSIYSDGREHPLSILYYSLRKGLQVVSITDHDTFRGSVVARRLALEKGLPIIVIHGIELRSDKGDVLIYCRHPHDFPRSIMNLLDRARDEGCLIFPAHPFDKTRKGIGGEVLDNVMDRIDGVECFNAGSLLPVFNLQAYAYAMNHGLPCLSNSDAHVAGYIGLYHTLLALSDFTEEEVFKALGKGKTLPVTGRVPYRLLVSKMAWSLERRMI